jgi:hypothetical protein
VPACGRSNSSKQGGRQGIENRVRQPAGSLGAGGYLLAPRVKDLATTPSGVLRRRGESERRARTTAVASVAAAHIGTSGVPTDQTLSASGSTRHGETDIFWNS